MQSAEMHRILIKEIYPPNFILGSKGINTIDFIFSKRHNEVQTALASVKQG